MLNPVKIFIIDDHSIVREGLKQVINLEDDLQVKGEAGSIEEAIKKIGKEVPDLALVDISLNGESSGIDLLKVIRDRFPSVKTLVLSMHEESLYAERAIRAGARGYLMKKNAHSDIIEAIRKVNDGELFLSQDVSMRIVDKLIHGAPESGDFPVEQLSNRELEVFQLMGHGFGTSEIADKLKISVNTVQSYKRHLKEKMAIRNSSELMKCAVQWVQKECF